MHYEVYSGVLLVVSKMRYSQTVYADTFGICKLKMYIQSQKCVCCHANGHGECTVSAFLAPAALQTRKKVNIHCFKLYLNVSDKCLKWREKNCMRWLQKSICTVQQNCNRHTL